MVGVLAPLSRVDERTAIPLIYLLSDLKPM